MGGIVNYYHGEEGVVSAVRTQPNDDRIVRSLELLHNAHRRFAFAYGGDILIDPRIVVGDTVRFVRLTPYDGVWVREHDFGAPSADEAAQLAARTHVLPRPPNIVTVRLEGVWADEAPEFEGIDTGIGRQSERPATDASFFISYSSKNVLLARAIVRDLQYDTHVDVWFDLEQSAGSDWPRERAERWLRQGVFASKGFVLLLTESSLRSDWVRKEIDWALNRSRIQNGFRFIVLKLADIAVPSELAGNAVIIDGNGLWAINGIKEELVAAVLGREGRVAWCRRNEGYELPGIQGQALCYSDFTSTSGTAIRLHKPDDSAEPWVLEYEEDGRLIRIENIDRDCIVDPGIRYGDQVASFVCNRNRLYRFWPGYKIWMRSSNLTIQPEDVFDACPRRPDRE